MTMVPGGQRFGVPADVSKRLRVQNPEQAFPDQPLILLMVA